MRQPPSGFRTTCSPPSDQMSSADGCPDPAVQTALLWPPAGRPNWWRPASVQSSGFTFSFFFQIPPFAGNEISTEISPKFANSKRKGNSNSKNEILMDSDRNFGDFDRNSMIFYRKIMSFVIFLMFPRSNEKLLNTNFVQFFEIYNFCFTNFFIWAMVWKFWQSFT